MGRIKNFLRKDSALMGAIIGVFCPAAIFGILELIVTIAEMRSGMDEIIEIQKMVLLSMVANIFLLRYYLLKLKYDLTGRGILAVTFVIAILFAILEFTQ